MDILPTNLVDNLPAALLPDAEVWWGGLSAQERADLWRLCDVRKDVFLFETFSDSDDGPSVAGSKFTPGANAFGVDDWGEDYFQHLLDHPDLILVFDSEQRTFHIGCSRHVAARGCFVDGSVSKDFKCPFAASDCLMHNIVGERASVNLRPLSQNSALLIGIEEF